MVLLLLEIAYLFFLQQTAHTTMISIGISIITKITIKIIGIIIIIVKERFVFFCWTVEDGDNPTKMIIENGYYNK